MRIMAEKNVSEQAQIIEFTEQQIEIFARRMLPEIKRYFADDSIQREFEEWRSKLNK